MPMQRERLESLERVERVVLDQTQAIMVDLALLDRIEALPGIDRSLRELFQALPETRRQRNREVINGLYFLVLPRRPYASFDEYLQELADQDPHTWVERLLTAYGSIDCIDCLEPPEEEPAQAELLADVEVFLSFLRRRFKEDHIDEAVERQAHRWLNDPPAMKAAVLEHLHFMWDEYLQSAWNRSLPLLEECQAAFAETAWPTGSRSEVAEWVTGQPLKEWQIEKLENAAQIRFVPSAHLGPYVYDIIGEDAVWLVFGARLPAGATVESSALSRSDLLMKLDALADDTRLQILGVLATKDEICAQDVIDQMGLSQSSASRHLRLLSATGFIHERRVESAKCYRLNREGIETVVSTLQAMFGLEIAGAWASRFERMVGDVDRVRQPN